MKDQKNTREQLIEELAELRQRIAELEAPEAERGRVEEELRSVHRKLQATFDAIQDLVNVVDLDFNLTDVNDPLIKAFGLPDKESVVGRKCFEVLKGRKDLCPNCAVAEAYRTKAPAYRTTTPEDEASTGRSFEIFAYPIIDEQGNLSGAVEFARDVTERKRAEEALRESKERYRSVVEHSHAGILIVDNAYRFIYVNDEWSRVFGYSREEIVGQDFRTFLDDESKQFMADRYVRRQSGEKVPPRYEFNIVRKDGEKRRVEVSSTVIEDSAGRVQTMSQILDITEHKRMEEAAQRSERQLAIRNRISEIFLTIPDEEMYGEVLKVVLEVMESKYGAFGYVDEDGALVCPSMTRDIWDSRQITDRDTVFPHETWGSIWGCALTEKKTLYSNEPFRVPEGHIPIHRALDVPIIHRGEVIGNLLVGNKATDYRKEDCELLETVADHIAPILHARLQRDSEEKERRRAEEQVRRHLERIEALREIDRAITSTLDLTGVLNIILEELESVIPYHSAGVYLFSEGIAGLMAGRGFSDLERVLQISFPVEEDPLTCELLQGKHPLVLADAQADERFLARGGTDYVRSWIGVPMIAKDRAVGFLAIDHREPGVYDEESAEIVQAFASQVAIAIENVQLYEKAQRELAERKRAEEELRQSFEKLGRALEGTITTLASVIEIRDPYTAGHQRRTTQLACAIARDMDLPDEQIEGLRMAGLIHDLGKISIPAEVLSNPNPLNDFQWDLIKAHPQIGYDILKSVEFPWPVAETVLQHHERLDGSGYPQKLSSRDILMKAKILAVADVVEAMASFRPYRPACGIDKALEEISQNRDILYDSEVVGACLKLFTEEGFEFEQEEEPS